MLCRIKNTMPSHGRTVRRGFTLIELLVVIAIIAILAAILFPLTKFDLRLAGTRNDAATLFEIGVKVRR
jgi:prepilin-type N-terminal cleavage/methylation domain-containing protein